MSNRIFQAFLFVILFCSATISLAAGVDSPDHPGCQRLNASRLPAPECGREGKSPLVLKGETEITTKITLSEIETLNCQAEIAMQYVQMNTTAKIEGSIENEICAASGGSFVISLSVRDSNSDVKILDFPQEWVRENDQAVSFHEEFSIGEGVDLIRARALKVQCKCATPSKTD